MTEAGDVVFSEAVRSVAAEDNSEYGGAGSRFSEDDEKEFWSCLALLRTPGIGPATVKRLITTFGTAYKAVMQCSEWRRKNLVREDSVNAFLADAWREAAHEEWKSVRGNHYKVLLWNHPFYPKRLFTISSPPPYLYYEGDPSLLTGPAVAIVGSRICTPYGRETVRIIANEISEAGVTVVSGLALGIDREAHGSGLEGIGRSVAVLGTGIDSDYPRDNRDIRQQLRRHGLILTEFAPETPADPRNFPRRNRIISGLSLGVLVAQAAARSGALITASTALDQNREVYVLRGPKRHQAFEGCRRLIEEGAKAVCSAEEILMDLAPLLKSEWIDRTARSRTKVQPTPTVEPKSPKKRPKAVATKKKSQTYPKETAKIDDINIGPDEAVIVQLLKKHEELHIDRITETTGWEAAKTAGILSMMEINGLVVKKPGMLYVLNPEA